MLTLDEGEIAMLARLRRNARESLSSISRATGIPVTTLFYKHRNLETCLISKYTSIIDFIAAGHSVRIWLVARASQKKSSAFESLLRAHKNVNNAYRVAGENGLNGNEYLAEGVFKDYGEAQEFTEKIQEAGARLLLFTVVSEDLKKEGFLTKAAHFY